MQTISIVCFILCLTNSFISTVSAGPIARLFESVNDEQFFLVPDQVTSIKVTLYAGSGANSTRSHIFAGNCGKGGMISSNLPVIPGELLMVMVGSTGKGVKGGFNGGGAVALLSESSSIYAGGGGATDVRRSPYTLADRILIAGAGGGGGGSTVAVGGNGGLKATRGMPPYEIYVPWDTAMPGEHHLQEPTCVHVNPGPLGQDCNATAFQQGGGGGGGYYGGGASSWQSGGGGGSSFSLYSILDEATGFNVGDGRAVFEWEESPALHSEELSELL